MPTDEFKQRIESLRYFNSEDFKTKLYADVINRISEDNAQIDGQLLIGMRARAKPEDEKKEVTNLINLLDSKKTLAEDFFKATQELAKLMMWND